jgi:hypothetical protein
LESPMDAYLPIVPLLLCGGGVLFLIWFSLRR